MAFIRCITSGLLPDHCRPPIIPVPLRKVKGMSSERAIDVTASICLDFAMPAPFRDLDSKPGLILAPARTWDPAIGNRIVALWGRARGLGTVGIPHPFDSNRTFYSRVGDASVVAASWFLVLGLVTYKKTRRNALLVNTRDWVVHNTRRSQQAVAGVAMNIRESFVQMTTRRKPAVAGVANEPNLIELIY
ncbi:hypothetical protein B0H14DRAFT_2676925, partial [Mycena olivaceomarginata]